jgi:hypothetical protein
VPPRKRHRQPPAPTDPVVRFGRGLIEEAEKEQAERMRIQAERAEAKRQKRLAEERAQAIATARSRLDRAIAMAKEARATGRGVAAADAEWKAAKAALIELETGQAPDWARGTTPM